MPQNNRPEFLILFQIWRQTSSDRFCQELTDRDKRSQKSVKRSVSHVDRLCNHCDNTSYTNVSENIRSCCPINPWYLASGINTTCWLFWCSLWRVCKRWNTLINVWQLRNDLTDSGIFFLILLLSNNAERFWTRPSQN